MAHLAERIARELPVAPARSKTGARTTFAEGRKRLEAIKHELDRARQVSPSLADGIAREIAGGCPRLAPDELHRPNTGSS
jgi:hypothetical protein